MADSGVKPCRRSRAGRTRRQAAEGTGLWAQGPAALAPSTAWRPGPDVCLGTNASTEGCGEDGARRDAPVDFAPLRGRPPTWITCCFFGGKTKCLADLQTSACRHFLTLRRARRCGRPAFDRSHISCGQHADPSPILRSVNPFFFRLIQPECQTCAVMRSREHRPWESAFRPLVSCASARRYPHNPQYNGIFRRQPDRKNAFAGASGGGDGPDIQPSSVRGKGLNFGRGGLLRPA